MNNQTYPESNGSYYCETCCRPTPTRYEAICAHCHYPRKNGMSVPITGLMLKILSGYWEGQGDPLYAICSRAVADGANMDNPKSCGVAHNVTEEEVGRVMEIFHKWIYNKVPGFMLDR